MYGNRNYCQYLMKLEFSGKILEKYQNSKFHAIRPVGADLFHAEKRTDGQTDMKKLIVHFEILRTRLKQ